MEIAIIAALSSIFGVAVGGIVSYYLQKQKLKHDFNQQKQSLEHEFKLKLQENKTENIAESTVKYYLKNEGFTERSFKHLKTKLGGFEEEELRRILVRAGAVRFIRKDTQEEFWCLVERLPEKYKKDNDRKSK